MAMGPRLDLRQAQSLVMTPQLQQAIKLLALSNLEIETFIGDALDANPLLDLAEAPPPETSQTPEEARRTTLETSPIDQLIGEGRAAEDRPLDVDASALDMDRDTGDGGDMGLGPAPQAAEPAYEGPYDGGDIGGGDIGSGSGGEAPGIDEHGGGESTLAEHLHAQIGAVARDARLGFIARFLIDQLDEAGYLPIALEELASDLQVPLAEMEAALALVQSLDPTGVGARNLSECIALQAKEADRYDPAMARMIANLEMIARGELPRLRKMCGVDEEDFADMLRELRHYDPKPGLRFGGGVAEAVVPDILITKRADGGWNVALNQATLPRLIVNRSYYVEMKGVCAGKSGKSKLDRGWLSEKLADANWLIKALDQRAKTILKVASELVKQQDGFFRHGVSHLKPLTLRAVAEEVGLHESTVSRVTSNKFLLCARGTFELKYFFTSGVASSDGEGAVSAEAVKAAIKQLIDNEDPKKILSDDTLVDLLKERGYDLARRTVAKYREAIGLGSSVQRRRQKALR